MIKTYLTCLNEPPSKPLSALSSYFSPQNLCP